MTGIVSKINQGRFDTEKELVNLLNNSRERSNINIQDAVEQRLRKIFPKVYQRLVGPLYERKRDTKFNCYCNYSKSLEGICQDIISLNVPIDALRCDACWKEDLCTTWGYYGFSGNKISKQTWKALNDDRAEYKFVE